MPAVGAEPRRARVPSPLALPEPLSQPWGGRGPGGGTPVLWGSVNTGHHLTHSVPLIFSCKKRKSLISGVRGSVLQDGLKSWAGLGRPTAQAMEGGPASPAGPCHWAPRLPACPHRENRGSRCGACASESPRTSVPVGSRIPRHPDRGGSSLTEGKWFTQEPTVVPRETLRGRRRVGQECELQPCFQAKPPPCPDVSPRMAV